jgi:hypothetical protein
MCMSGAVHGIVWPREYLPLYWSDGTQNLAG